MRTSVAMRTCEPAPSVADAPDMDLLIRRLADTLHKLNEQVVAAVRAGVTVELVRGSRVHDGLGQWGDQIVPVIRMPD
jgi:hypothetical protein